MHEKFHQQALQELAERGRETLVLVGGVVELGRGAQDSLGRARPYHHRHFDLESVEQLVLQWIATERIGQDMAKFGITNQGAPMEVMGKVVRWLCTEPDADQYNGRNIEAQYFCHEKGLLPGWDGPQVQDNSIRLDTSGANLLRLEAELAAGKL